MKMLEHQDVGQTWLLKGNPPCDKHRTAGKGRPACVDCDNRTTVQRVVEACPFRDAHEPENTGVACGGCGLYVGAIPRVAVYDETGEPYDMVLRTETGRIITEEDIDQWADEAAAGYDLEEGS